MPSANPDARPRPPRAEPLQPDLPGKGDDKMPADADGANSNASTSAERQRQQSEDALHNVRDGYK